MATLDNSITAHMEIAGERFEVPAPAWAFGAAALLIAFQIVPLPPGLIRWLSPRAHELFEFVLGPEGRYPAWRPLSLSSFRPVSPKPVHFLFSSRSGIPA